MTSENAKKALLKMFQCYNWTGSDVERKLKFEAYWEILSELAPDAIVAVCLKASRGEIGQPAFLPSAGELFHAVTPYGNKQPPKWAPGQNRFLSSTGVLWINNVSYSPEEQTAWTRGQWPPLPLCQELREKLEKNELTSIPPIT